MTPDELENFIRHYDTCWTKGHYFTVYAIARAMAKTLPSVSALEIGVGTGGMTVAILAGLTASNQNVRLVSVDEYLTDMDRCLSVVRTHLAINNLLQHWVFCRANSHEWSPPCQFDLCVIDSDHTLEGMWQDFIMCAENLNPHGLIIMHDTEVHQGREFIKELEQNRDWNAVTIPFYNGLSIIRRASDPSFGYRDIEDW
jgi:predicted O-methyltransferase YrrM